MLIERVKVDALLHHSFDFSNIVTRKNVCVVQCMKLGHGYNRVCALSVCIHKDAIATEDYVTTSEPEILILGG